VALATAWQTHTVTSPAFVVGVVWIIFDSFALTGYSALRAIKRNGQVAVFQALSPLLLLAALWLSRGLLSPLLLLTIQAGASATVTALMLAHVWRLGGSPGEHRFDLRYVIGGAWLFVAADVLATLYTQVGLVILGNTADTLQVGHFRAALNVLAFSYLVPSLVFAVGLPLLNEASASRHAYRPLLRTMAGGAALYGLTAGFGLWLFGDLAVRVLYGDEYMAALPYVRAMSFLPLVKAVSFVCAAVLLSCDRLRLRVALQAAVTPVNLAAAALVIPAYGVSGALWVIVATELLVCSLYLLGALSALRRAQL
jgi:O-antigen/teichoic acid export membrane protein